MKKSIIPCLDIKDARVVKGKKFMDLRDAADPVERAKYYVSTGADELVFYDITASAENRSFDLELFLKVKAMADIPLTVGGAIASIADIERAFESGATKVSINTGAINDKELISRAAKRFGSERIMFAIDAKKTDRGFNIFTNGGRLDTGIDAVEWVVKAENDGAGEVVVNSIDADGVKCGYDIPMLETIMNRTKLKVIASGGAGKKEDFLELFLKLPDIAAALAASVFHYNEVNIRELKEYLSDNGIFVYL